uniref:FLZ-type domain-containing protein n=2 Tax=Cannabis sativa TaxID=3483 RepID=A0A803PC83_CANSA
MLASSINGPDSFSHLLPSHISISLPIPLPSSLSPLSLLSLSLLKFLREKPIQQNQNEKMLLGKRPRPPIKRTISMTGITVDPSSEEAPEPSDPQIPISSNLEQSSGHHHPHVDDGSQNNNMCMNFGSKGYQDSFMSILSPRIQRRNSADFIETAHFLRTCGLCKRRLASGRDIYMYMGDTAFCSLECREKQMRQDDRKEKCMGALAASTNDQRRETTSSAKASSSSAGKSQTVAAA